MRGPKPIKVFREKPGSGDRGDLGRLMNLGPKSSAWLAEAGIRTPEQLRRLGPIEACRLLIRKGRPVSILMAYAIEGALSGDHWNALHGETRDHLRAEFARMKREEKSARRG